MGIVTPIRSLLSCLSDALSQLSEDFMNAVKRLTNSGQEKIHFKLNSDSGRIITPSVNENCVITLGESFLCYVWAMCYYGFVYFDEAMVPSIEIALGKLKHEDHNYSLAEEASALRKWALSICPGYVDWPQELPSPSRCTNKYIVPTCVHFVHAVSFFIEHEIAHIYLKHFEDNREPLEKEIEADKQAIEWHMNSEVGKSFSSKMGVLLGLCSMLALDSQSDKPHNNHPSMYSRILRYIDSLDDENKEPYYQVFALYIWDWDKQFCVDNDFDFDTTDAKSFVIGVLIQMEVTFNK